MTYSYSGSESFTRSDAKRLSGKVSGDLAQCLAFYGEPTQAQIDKYNEELVILLAGRYVEEYEFGFQRAGKRIVSWQYRVGDAGLLVGGRAGGLTATADITGAIFFNFLTYSWAWTSAGDAKRQSIRQSLPFNRSDGEPPDDGNGYWIHDRDYTSGGVALTRKEFRPW